MTFRVNQSVNQSLAKTAASVNYPSARLPRLTQIDAPFSSRLSRDRAIGSSRFRYPGSRDPRIPDLGFHTPRCHRTSGRLPQPRRHWLCTWHRRSSEYPLDTPCRTEDRTDTRILPSLSHVTQSAASGHLAEFPGCPISPPSPLSTST